MVDIVNREELIKFLLRREFGSLAPPPSPTLGTRSIEAALSKANWDHNLRVAGKSSLRPGIERKQEQYEKMDTAALQVLVEGARAEDARKAKERSIQNDGVRAAYWPHWAKKDLWSEAELAALCCGWVPDEPGRPSDPGKDAAGDYFSMGINRANDDIRRGILSGTLTFISRNDADTAAHMYGNARHYVPAIAAEWAVSRFETFPLGLLAAIRERVPPAQAHPAPITDWPWGAHETELLRKLAAAAERFWKLYDPNDPTTAPKNDVVVTWLKKQGVAERNAQVMATILRADGLPTGPRK